jgi:hypothetical protein
MDESSQRLDELVSLEPESVSIVLMISAVLGVLIAFFPASNIWRPARLNANECETYQYSLSTCFR